MTNAQASKGESSKQAGIYAKGVDLGGKVSSDGKVLVANDDNIWSVNNTGKLKGLEGRQVTVKCQMYPDQHAISILYIIEAEIKHAAKWADPAFRR